MVCDSESKSQPFSIYILITGHWMIATRDKATHRPGEMAWLFHRLDENRWSYSSFWFEGKTLQDFSLACDRYMTAHGGQYIRETIPTALVFK